MKKTGSKISLFLGGFLLMAIAHLAIQCENYIGPNNGDDQVLEKNRTEVTKTGNKIEEAFLSGNPDKVLDWVTPSALEHYTELIEGSSSENLKLFGEAFKARELTLVSERYAEFAFIVDGAEFTVALSLGPDGSWKLMRL
ncbi:MAG: hypothetical protein R6V75_01060 [Bacteroidales bacterium]